MKMFYTKFLMIMILAAAFIGCPPATGETVKISFSPNGGVGTMADQEVMTGTDAALNANTFKRVGYEFDGWNDAADGSGKAYADKGKINVGSAVKLYAQWKPAPLQNLTAVGGNGQVILTWDAVQILYEKIEITYDGAGEPVTVTSQNDPDDTATVTGLTNEKEYTFTATVSANGKKSRTATVKGTPSLSNAPVTVTFNSNPPESLPDQDSYTQVVLVNQPTVLTACKFVYAGYTCKGWAKTAEAAVADYTDGGELTATEEDLANNGITLYAVWGKTPLTKATVTLPEDVSYLIGGTTVSLTETLEPAGAYVSSVSVEVTDSGSAAYDFAAKTLTLPSNTAEAGSQYTVTLKYHTVNEEGTEAVISATLGSLTVYPDKWLVYDNALYKNAAIFDFTVQTNVSNVTFNVRPDNQSWRNATTVEQAAMWQETDQTGGVNFNMNGKDYKIVLPQFNGSKPEIIMVEFKWAEANAQPNVLMGTDQYGYTFYRSNKHYHSFFLLNDWQPPANGSNKGYQLNPLPSAGTFNRFYVYDNMLIRSAKCNDGKVFTYADLGEDFKMQQLSALNPLQIEFGDDSNPGTIFTLKTVAFYTAVTP